MGCVKTIPTIALLRPNHLRNLQTFYENTRMLQFGPNNINDTLQALYCNALLRMPMLEPELVLGR